MASYGEVEKGEPLIAQFMARKLGKYTFELYPDLWATPGIAEYYSGRNWTITRFTDAPEIEIPSQSGIYMFVVAPRCGNLDDHSYIFYVGKTDNLRRRYREYFEERAGRGPNPREEVVVFLNHLRDHVFFHFTLVSEDELTRAECLLKDNLTPPANKMKEIIGRLKPV